MGMKLTSTAVIRWFAPILLLVLALPAMGQSEWERFYVVDAR